MSGVLSRTIPEVDEEPTTPTNPDNLHKWLDREWCYWSNIPRDSLMICDRPGCENVFKNGDVWLHHRESELDVCLQCAKLNNPEDNCEPTEAAFTGTISCEHARELCQRSGTTVSRCLNFDDKSDDESDDEMPERTMSMHHVTPDSLFESLTIMPN
jgi:hypothetical protein